MEKILRLSFANIRKHKKQTALLILLIILCMAITSSALAGAIDINSIFPRVSDKLAVHKSAMFINEEYYTDSMMDLLLEDERVTSADCVDALFSSATKYIDKTGEEQSLYMSFVPMDTVPQIQRFKTETTLSDAEIAALEHPIYLPFAGRDSLKSRYKPGETFDVVYGAKLFSFTIAGFYESVFMANTSMGFQMVVSDSDYLTLSRLVTRQKMVLFDCDPAECSDKVFTDFNNRAEELTGRDVGYNTLGFMTYSSMKITSAAFSDIIVAIMLFMSVVIFVASTIMIRFRIAGDIQDQIQSIGVLEALGYTSKEISLSYTLEYLTTALAGIIAGAAAGAALLPLLHKVGTTLSGHHADMLIEPLPILLTAAVILAFVGLIAHIRASSVKKFPPVQAFRKGIASHHFGKNRFPLRNTRGSVHIRLAMKGFFGNRRQNIGLAVCIAVSAIAAVIGLMSADTFGTDLKAANQLAGTEMPEITVSVMKNADADDLAERISGMDGVRKTKTGSFSLDISEWKSLYAFDREMTLIPICYTDFSDCENISATAGRLPEHDNEVAISKLLATMKQLNVGDNLTLECNSIKKNYVISGTVPSVTNSGSNLYITEAALKRIIPAYHHSAVEIYLEDGADKAEFQTRLMQSYGKTVADTRLSGNEGGTMEDRLRAAAEKRVAEYLMNHGVNHVEYSIEIDGKTISGTSDSFVIKNIQNLAHIMQTQIGGYFKAISATSWVLMGLAGVVSMIIIIALMEQTVRRQRKDLGIMMGLGYTTKELMVQLAMRIMPAVLFAVILGTAGAVVLFNVFMEILVGAAVLNIPMLIAAVLIMTLFCFASAYIGAGRIKKISVTELMTE